MAFGVDPILAEKMRAILDSNERSIERLPTTGDLLLKLVDGPGFGELPEHARGLKLPIQYKFGGRPGGLFFEKGDESNPENVYIPPYPPLPSRIHREPDGTEHVELLVWQRAQWVRHMVERSALYGSRVGELLGRLGVALARSEVRDVAEFVTCLLQVNADHMPTMDLVVTTGYVGEITETGSRFMLGGTCIDRGEVVDSVSLTGDDDILRTFDRRGTFEKSIELLEKFLDPLNPHTGLMILASLATPLLRGLRVTGTAVHLHGASSSGKTVSLKLAVSIWGDPNVRGDNTYIRTWQTTANAVELLAQRRCDLPLALDESGLMDRPTDGERIAYGVVGGQVKQRATRQAGLRKSNRYRTILLSTGEGPLLSVGAHVGAIVRTLQLPFKKLEGVNQEQVERLEQDLASNHGHVGRRLIEELTKLGTAEWEVLRKRHDELTRELAALMGGHRLAGRQANALAVMGVAEELAHQWLGLGAPGARVVRHVASDRSLLPRLRSEHEKALDAMSAWLAEQPHRFRQVVIDANGKKATQPTHMMSDVAGYIENGYGVNEFDDGSSSDLDDGLVHFLPGPLGKWLREAGIARDTAVRALADRGALVGAQRGDLQSKLRVDGKRARVYSVRIASIHDPNMGGGPDSHPGHPSSSGPPDHPKTTGFDGGGPDGPGGPDKSNNHIGTKEAPGDHSSLNTHTYVLPGPSGPPGPGHEIIEQSGKSSSGPPPPHPGHPPPRSSGQRTSPADTDEDEVGLV